jgi:glycosyltransferase involved in cell wall biosynthesis
MRVLFHLPFQILHRANGGKTVFLKTKEYLERAGIQVDLFDPWNTDLKHYDLVHSFSMESTDMWHYAKSCGARPAVTPISWFGPYATRRSLLFRWLKRRVRSKIRCPLHAYWWEDCFRFPDMFFPQSKSQAGQLRFAFGVTPSRISVVYHGVDERFASGNPAPFRQSYKIGDFVLCVGRVDPMKNQLSLIKALKGTGIPLVLVGRPDTPSGEWYYRQCVEEADNTVVFIRELHHDSPLLGSAYAAARVLVLPSYQEIPGLAALEAGLAGCNVAVTKVGVAQEYLGDRATYLDPGSFESIREAVVSCYENGPGRNTALQDHIMRNFLWEKVVHGNIAGYQRVLESSG